MLWFWIIFTLLTVLPGIALISKVDDLKVQIIVLLISILCMIVGFSGIYHHKDSFEEIVSKNYCPNCGYELSEGE